MTTPVHLERQLRAGLARLMAAETHPAARMAQIRWIEALLTIETLAALLAIIDAERAKTPTEAQLFALLPGVWYRDLPDGGAPDLLTMLQRMADDAAKWRGMPGATGAAAPAPVYENPASKREIQPGMPGYNDGSKREEY